MNLVTRALPNDNYLWWIYGAEDTEWFWSRFQAGGGFYESQWLTISHRPVIAPSEAGIIDLSGNNTFVDPRDADAVTFDIDGRHMILPRNVEYFDSSLATTTEIRWLEHFGATTDGSLDILFADVGNHDFDFTAAIKDSSLHLGAGWDRVDLIDHRDIPGEQYWALIRRDNNELDAYSLLTGRRIRMEDGLESRNGLAGKHNFGEVEILTLADSRNGGIPVYKPGEDLPSGRGTFTNIDLRSDGQTHSDSFNLAYFNFIRYTSDNVWVGEATIHDGTKWSAPTDRTVTSAKYGVDAPILEGQLSVIGSSRNGTHDLIISERPIAAANSADAGSIDGHFRLYTRNVESGLYNEFNEVFIGTELADGVVDKSDAVGHDSLLPGAGSDRIYQVGTSGTDDLRGWNGTTWVPVKIVNQLQSIDYTGATPTFDRTFTNTLHDLIEQGAVPTAAPSVEDQNKTIKVGSTFYEWTGSGWVTVTAGDKVFLRTNGEYSVWDGSSLNEVLIVEPQHRVALYGFGGNDVLKGGAGRDYIFGGKSVYNLINSVTGNEVWGGAGADYFGAGSLDAAGDPDGNSSVLSDSQGGFLQGYATDVIMDWHAGEDTLVVLENGVAVIGGLRDSTGLVSLSGNNIIDLRDYAAIATSDQDADGARGGADRDINPSDTALSTTQDWDATKSLNYIFDNQAVRDANSITNEDDRTVVNNGLIVTRGLNGDDIIFASAGHDYLYGNKGADLIVLSEGGTNRVYFDSFDSTLVSPKLASIYVADFNDGADQFFVNKQVIDAFGGDTGRALSAVNVTGTYAQAIAYDPNINFLHDRFYSPSIYDANSSHRSNDGSGAFGDNSGTDTESPFGGADGTTFGIGVGMFAAGLALTFIPFGQIAGRALMATGTLLGGGVTVIGTTEHENAIFTGNVGNYLNVITSDTLQAAGNTVVATSNDRKDAQVRFLDFFGGSDAGDGFVPVVEFTAHSGEGIHGYFALHSSEETFVFLVSSTDNLVENDEAIKVAEINGLLTAEDFKIYDGAADIYNPGTVTPIVILSPSIESIKDSASPTPKVPVDVNGEKRIDGVTNPLDVEISVNGTPSQSTYLMVYDGRELIYDGSAQNLVDTDVDIIGFVDNTYTLRDKRAIGTVGVQTDTEVVNNVTVLRDLSEDNSFIVQDSIVNYSVVLIDGETGMPRRTSSGPITVSGGNNTIIGGDGDDTLNVTGTSAFINGATDAQIRGIETVLLTAEDTNAFLGEAFRGIDAGDDSPFLDLSNQTDADQDTGVNGFKIIGSSIADSIIASQGDDTILGGGGQDTIELDAGGDDVVFFSYGSSGIGVDNQYDIVLNMVGGSDKIEVAASGTTDAAVLDGDGNPTYDADDELITEPVNTSGFDDRDGDATRLMYEASTTGANAAVASGTELLVVSNSVVGTTGDLTANIAAALDSAFDVDGLDGRAPSATTGLESDTSSTASSVLFAVKSNEPDKWWVGRYEDPAGAADGSVSGGNIEVFALVETDSILDSFWLDTILAPQALSLSLPSDTYSSSPEYATNVDTFSVGGVASGNSVYYSVNTGASWATTTSTSGIHLPDGTYGVGSIQVRQVDGSGNYSPISEITTNSSVMIIDTVDPSVGSIVKSGSDTGFAAFSAGLGDITLSWSVSDVNPFDTIVEYKLSTSSSWISVDAASNSAGTHSVNVNDLSEGTYNWRVTHIDDAGNSTTTNGVNFTLVPPDNIAPTATPFSLFNSDGTGYFGYRFTDTGGSGLNLSSLSVTRADVQVRFEGNGEDNWYDEYQDGFRVVGDELRIYPRRINSSDLNNSGPVYDTWSGSDHRVFLNLSVSDNAGNTLTYNDNFLFDAGNVGYYTGTWSAQSITDYLGGTDPTSAHPNYSGP